MMKFIKDYAKLLSMNVKFYRNHWKGCIAVCGMIWGGFVGYLAYINGKFT